MRAHRLLVVAAVVGCAGRAARPATVAVPVAPPAQTDSVASLLATLTVRQQIGQLIIPWLSGNYTALDDSLFQTARSEEHTSELQSRRDLVCRLPLEKKKTTLPFFAT